MHLWESRKLNILYHEMVKVQHYCARCGREKYLTIIKDNSIATKELKDTNPPMYLMTFAYVRIVSKCIALRRPALSGA